MYVHKYISYVNTCVCTYVCVLALLRYSILMYERAERSCKRNILPT